MAHPTLVLLAAGMARRFGSLKQVTPVGPGDEALVDHTVRDAVAAGIDRVVVVVRPEIRDEVVGHLARRTPVPLVAVEQPGPGPDRLAPWGAAEAVALALPRCTGPAVVANADDYYGRDAMEALVGHLCAPDARPERAALVTWPLVTTASSAGPVTRALCRTDAHGLLSSLEERRGVIVDPEGQASDVTGLVPSEAPVSMNLWGLPPPLALDLSGLVARFRADHGHDPTAELPLPTAIDAMVAAGLLEVEVLPVGTTWVGITHPQDLDEARRAMAGRAPVPVR